MLASAAIEALNIMEQKPGNSETVVTLHCNPLVSKTSGQNACTHVTMHCENYSQLLFIYNASVKSLQFALYFKFLDMFDDLREKAKLLHAELDG